MITVPKPVCFAAATSGPPSRSSSQLEPLIAFRPADELPGDFDAPCSARERAILTSVCREFVKRHADSLRGGGRYDKRWPPEILFAPGSGP